MTTMNQELSAKKFHAFTAASLAWCSKEAEQGTERVTQAISNLLQDIDRVSKMSEDSLKALNNLQHLLKGVDKENYAQLKKSLTTLSQENKEIDGYIQPIMEALQFQDRFRQNLENIVRMIDVWEDFKSRPELDSTASAAMMTEFGKALIAKTTMKRERDIVRTYIDGLEPEQEISRVELF